jgi:hypothetical protein
MAISVGNVHLQQDHEGGLDEPRIRAIEAVTDVPLVIHGGSGVPLAQRAALAAGRASASSTSARNSDGLRRSAARGREPDPDRFDRVAILKETHEPVMAAARQVIRGLRRKLKRKGMTCSGSDYWAAGASARCMPAAINHGAGQRDGGGRRRRVSRRRAEALGRETGAEVRSAEAILASRRHRRGGDRHAHRHPFRPDPRRGEGRQGDLLRKAHRHVGRTASAPASRWWRQRACRS